MRNATRQDHATGRVAIIHTGVGGGNGYDECSLSVHDVSITSSSLLERSMVSLAISTGCVDITK